MELTDNTEVSYNKYLVDNANELKNLAAGMDTVIKLAPAIGDGNCLVMGYNWN